jgi:putative aminopeptidase FrvX
MGESQGITVGEIVPNPQTELRVWNRELGAWRILDHRIGNAAMLAIAQILANELDVTTIDNGDGTYTHTFK